MSFRRLALELRELSELLSAGIRQRLQPPRSERRSALLRCCQDFDIAQLLATPLNDARVVILDTETTGLEPYAGDALVEIAMLEYRGLEPTGREVCSLIHPGRAIPARATAIHGLTDADVVDAPSLERILDDVVAFLDGALVVGHHVGFDLRFLNRAALRHLHCRLPFPVLNTMVLFQAWSGQRGYYSLDQVASACGIGVQNRHNARGDAMACAAIFRHLAAHLTTPESTVADLLAVSPPDPEYGPHYSRSPKPTESGGPDNR